MLNQSGSVEAEFNNYDFVASSDAVEEGEIIEINIGKKTLVIGRQEGAVYAVDGICSHAYAELADGELEDHCLYCPLHFASFDIRDGSVLEGPAEKPLSVYNVMEEGNSIWISRENV